MDLVNAIKEVINRAREALFEVRSALTPTQPSSSGDSAQRFMTLVMMLSGLLLAVHNIPEIAFVAVAFQSALAEAGFMPDEYGTRLTHNPLTTTSLEAVHHDLYTPQRLTAAIHTLETDAHHALLHFQQQVPGPDTHATFQQHIMNGSPFTMQDVHPHFAHMTPPLLPTNGYAAVAAAHAAAAGSARGPIPLPQQADRRTQHVPPLRPLGENNPTPPMLRGFAAVEASARNFLAAPHGLPPQHLLPPAASGPLQPLSFGMPQVNSFANRDQPKLTLAGSSLVVEKPRAPSSS